MFLPSPNGYLMGGSFLLQVVGSILETVTAEMKAGPGPEFVGFAALISFLQKPAL